MSNIITSPQSGIIEFNTGIAGSDVFGHSAPIRLDATGGDIWFTGSNVGIETNSPQFTLDVNGAIHGTSGNFQTAITVGGNPVMTGASPEADTLQTVTNRGATTTNDISIGSATSPSFTSGGGLKITHATQANLRLSDSTDASYNTDVAMSNDDFFLVNRSATGHLKFRVNNSTEAITVLQDGKVGIGITNPQAKLDVAGNVNIGSTTSSAPTLNLIKSATGIAEIKFLNVSNEKASIQLDAAEDLQIFANTSQKIKLRSGGADTLTLDASQNATFAGSITTNLSSAGTYFTGGSGSIRQLSITSGTNISAHALHTFNIASSNGKYEFDINGVTELSLDSSSATFAGDIFISRGGTNGTTANPHYETLVSSGISSTNLSAIQLGNTFGSDNGTQLRFQINNTSGGSTPINALLLNTAGATFAGAVTVGGHILPSTSLSYDLGSDSKRFASAFCHGLSASSSVTTPIIQLQGNLKILNKAQTSYLDLATRDTSGSEVRYNLNYVGHVSLNGELNFTTNSDKYIDVNTIANGNSFNIRHHNPTGNVFKTAFQSAANGATTLYYNGAARFATTTDGIQLYGNGYLDMPDNGRIRLGASYDLAIYHDASHSYIDEVGTGDLRIRSNSATALLSSTNENMLVAIANGAVELYYDNSKKLETTSSGITVTGGITLGGTGRIQGIDTVTDGTDAANKTYVDNAVGGSGGPFLPLAGGTITGNVRFNDNKVLEIGSSADLSIYHDGTDSYLKNTVGHLFIRNDANDKNIIFVCDDGSGGITSYITLDGSAGYTTVQKKIRFADSVFLELGSGGDIEIYHNGSNSYINNNGSGGHLFISNYANDKDIVLGTDDGSGGVTPYLTLDGSHTQMLATKNLHFDDNVELRFGNYASPDLKIYHDGSDSYIRDLGTGELRISGSKTRIYDADLSSLQAEFIDGGSVDLYYDSNKKFETTISGVAVSTTTTATLAIQSGSNNAEGSKMRLTEGATYNGGFIHYDGSANALKLGVHAPFNSTLSDDTNVITIPRDTGNVGIGTTAPAYNLTIADTLTSTPKTLLHFDANNITNGGGYNIDFRTSSNDTADRYVARIRGIREGNGATSQLSFWTENSGLFQRMTIKADGNVGIGTTSPTAKLYIEQQGVSWNATTQGPSVGTIHLDPVGDGAEDTGNAITFGASDTGNGATAQAGIYIRSDGSYGTKMYLSTTDSYASGSKTRLMINHNGNVGIGTTSPTDKLDVVGDNAKIFLQSADYKIARIQPRGTGANLDKGLFSLFDGSTEDVRIDTAGNSWFNGGNVGIGQGSPSKKLDVNGAAIFGAGTTRLTTYSDSGYAGIYNGSSLTSDESIYMGGGNMFFYGDGAETIRILANGNVGIGTPSPARKLTIKTSTGSRNNAIGINDASGTEQATIALDTNTNDVSIAGKANLRFYSGSTLGGVATLPTNERVVITTAGNVGIGTTSPQAYLDIRGGGAIFSTTLTNNDDWQNSPVSILERGVVGSAQSADKYSPNLNFHWTGRVSTSLWMNSSGYLNWGSFGSTGIPTADGVFQTNTINLIGTGRITGVDTVSASTDAANKAYVDAQVGSADTLQEVTDNGNTTTNSITMTNSLTIDGEGSSSDVLKLKGSARIQVENASGNDSFYISNTGGSGASKLDLGGAVSIIEGGEVGIGTTSPDSGLHLQGASNTSSGFTIENTSGGTSKKFGFQPQYNDDRLDIWYNSNATAAITVKDGGNVGIGSTGPAYKLDVNGYIGLSSQIYFSAATAGIQVGGSWGNGVLNFRNGATTAIQFDVANGRIQNNLGKYLTASSGTGQFGTLDNQSVAIVANNSTKMQIDSAGKIQIGNNIPMWSGSYGGALFLKGNNANSDRYAQLTEVDSTGAATSYGLVVRGGKVGIGTTTPDASTLLHVQGVIGTTNGSAAAPTHSFYGDPDNGMFRAAANALGFSTSGAERMRISSTGEVVIYSNQLSVINSTGAQLQVSGWSDRVGSNNNANGTIYIGNTAAYRGVIDYDAASTGDLIISNTWNNANGDIVFKTATAGTAIEGLRIKGGGNVGIGADAAYKLEVNGGILAGGKVTYHKSAGSLNTTGYAVAGLVAGSNGMSAGFTFTCFGHTGDYQKIVYSCYNASGTWNTQKVIDEGTNDFDVTASANGSTITFTFKSRSGTKSYTPRVSVEAFGSSINNTYA